MTRGPGQFSGDIKVYSTKCIGTNGYPYGKKNNFDTYLIPYSKVNSKRIRDPNITA